MEFTKSLAPLSQIRLNDVQHLADKFSLMTRSTLDKGYKYFVEQYLFDYEADASRGPHAVTYNAAQGNAGTSGGHQGTSGTYAQENGASGQGTSGNDATEETSLIVRPSSSQESVPSSTLCCPKSQ